LSVVVVLSRVDRVEFLLRSGPVCSYHAYHLMYISNQYDLSITAGYNHVSSGIIHCCTGSTEGPYHNSLVSSYCYVSSTFLVLLVCLWSCDDHMTVTWHNHQQWLQQQRHDSNNNNSNNNNSKQQQQQHRDHQRW
jgi:hypothetical protein